MHHRFAPAAALIVALAACGATATASSPAKAEALLLIEADSGKVLHAENATYPWYPASITKLMTTYVALRAVKEGRIQLDTLISVSENALAQQPSKMGFPVGTRMTLDNALKMMLVKSANDMAVVIAEGVSGSIEAFSEEMNRASARLGMTQSSWVNPNGLPAEMQVTSARDMGILARTLIREFPQYDYYWHTPAIKFGRRVMRNYNKLIDRYPGADGMKTGFICASGYNLVASATRGGKRLIAIVLGASSGNQRTEKAAALLERGFNGGGGLSWLTPSLGTVDALQPIAAEPLNLREEICGKGRRARTDHAEEEEQPAAARDGDSSSAYASLLPSTRLGDKESLLGPWTPSAPPVVVTVIPPAGAPADPDALMARATKKKRGVTVAKKKGGKQTAVISIATETKSTGADKGQDKSAAKPKPAAKAATKPTAKPAAKPHIATAPKPDAKAKPKPAAVNTSAKSTAAKTVPAKNTAAKSAAAATAKQ